jgi:4-coumarate--CoA ligase
MLDSHRANRPLLSLLIDSPVTSPYPDIEPGPHPPLFEFVSSQWKAYGDRIAVVDGSTGLERTYNDYYETATSLAAALRHDMAVDEASTIAMYCPNHVDYLPVAMAASMLGAKVTPINPLYTRHELETVLQRSRSSVLVCHTATLSVAAETARHSDHVKHVIVLRDEQLEEGGAALPQGVVDLRTVVQPALDEREQRIASSAVPVHRTSSHPVLLPFSSGTTGLPKGVALSHHNLVTNLLQLDRIEGRHYSVGEAMFSPLPFFHIYGFTVSMCYAAWKGLKLVTMSRRFDLDTFGSLVEAHKPRRAHLVPPIILGMAKTKELTSRHDLSSLESIMSGAAPLGSDVERELATVLPNCTVKQGWGMSEMSPLGILNADDNVRSGSIGHVIPSTMAKVVDESGNSLPPNTVGELLIKGDQVMLGYQDEPVRTAECLCPESGWLRTGDAAYYDADGFIYIADRIKELIKVRGYQVPPAELEALLLTHPSVADAAVVQVPCERSGELPRAYVVLKNDAPIAEADEQSVYNWVKERVAPYKRLDGGVVFIDTIPKSASGKILRRVLRDADGASD